MWSDGKCLFGHQTAVGSVTSSDGQCTARNISAHSLEPTCPTRVIRPRPWVPTYKGRSDVTGIVGSNLLVNSGVQTRKNFCKTYRQFGHAPSKSFSRVLGRKELKNIGFKGCQIISLPGVPFWRGEHWALGTNNQVPVGLYLHGTKSSGTVDSSSAVQTVLLSG
jgi:hypothetical protein